MAEEKILFINGSPNRNGNTAALAQELLQGKDYETVNLVDYKIYSYGQEFPDDQFLEIVDKMRKAQVIVIGSPVYWHNMSGALRTLLDRFYGPIEQGKLKGRKLFFLFQGAAPTDQMLEFGEYTMSRFASLYGMTYMGMADSREEARKLSEKLK